MENPWTCLRNSKKSKIFTGKNRRFLPVKIKKYHIYLADLNPQYRTEPGKKRPVVVVQTDLMNNIHPSTIICPITTNVNNDANILRVHLFKEETKLKADSDILVDQIRAIDNKRFIKEISCLTRKHQEELAKNIGILILE